MNHEHIKEYVQHLMELNDTLQSAVETIQENSLLIGDVVRDLLYGAKEHPSPISTELIHSFTKELPRITGNTEEEVADNVVEYLLKNTDNVTGPQLMHMTLDYPTHIDPERLQEVLNERLEALHTEPVEEQKKEDDGLDFGSISFE